MTHRLQNRFSLGSLVGLISGIVVALAFTTADAQTSPRSVMAVKQVQSGCALNRQFILQKAGQLLGDFFDPALVQDVVCHNDPWAVDLPALVILSKPLMTDVTQERPSDFSARMIRQIKDISPDWAEYMERNSYWYVFFGNETTASDAIYFVFDDQSAIIYVRDF